MEGPPLGPGGEDITWPDQVAPRGRKASSTRKIKPQTSHHTTRHPREQGPLGHQVHRGTRPGVEPGPPPTTATKGPTTQRKVPGLRSSSLTGPGPEQMPPKPRPEPSEATVNPLDLNLLAITYFKDATAALQELPMAQGTELVFNLPMFQGQRDDPPEPIPLYTPDQKAYECYWHQGAPLYARAGIHVNLVHHLSIAGRLSVYEVVGDGWQLKIINTNVLSGDATEPLLQALAEAYRQMAIIAPAIIIGDMNAATSRADRGGQATPQDHAACDTIEMQGLVDLTANLEGQPSHFCHQTDAAPSRIDVCYGDPTTIIQAEDRYDRLLLGPTGHRPLQTRLTIPNLPPSPPEDADQGLPPRLKMPPLHDKQPWSHYHRAIERARRNQPHPTDLLTAMRTAAATCGLQQHPNAEDDQPPTALGDMLHDLWHTEQQLATLLHTYTTQTCRHPQGPVLT